MGFTKTTAIFAAPMYALIKQILFRFDPERIHSFAMRCLQGCYHLPGGEKLLKTFFDVKQPSLGKTVFGLHFKNPVGLAAGFDKDARWIDPLSCLGFGFIEIGTVTPLPQPGNPKPRLFRLPADKALINRMGFNNQGAEVAVARLKLRRSDIIVGGNIGKNKLTPNEQAASDYEKCFRALYDVVDYFVVNVSSPNTPDLRALQEKEPLKNILGRLQQLNAQQVSPKPILLKIAPDLSKQQLDDLIEIVQETELAGIVATNTTISRTGLRTSADQIAQIGPGGLSGQPIQQRSTELIRYIHQKTEGKIPIIASGGIFSAADAREKLAAGASLVQVYTGFIYEGPAIVKKICQQLSSLFASSSTKPGT